MVCFLIDAQLPPGLARQLKRIGHEAFHVSEVASAAATDKGVRDLAIERGAILVSKDEDFVSMNAVDELGCPLLWIRIGNTTNEALWTSSRHSCPKY
jgi:predicted nuclease of predicted toxin-antitoxin system